MPVGRIKVWISHKGFGFIVTGGTSPDIFVHISQIAYQPVQQGDIVFFNLKFDAQGRPQATSVKKVGRDTPLSIWEEIPEVRAKKAREIFSEALLARNNKDYQLARNLFEDAIRLSPEKNFFDAYAAMEKQLGNWDKVREIYNRARKHFPHDVSILEALAMAERRAGDLVQSVEILKQALREAPASPSLHLHLAQVLVDLAEKDKRFEVLKDAKEHFRRATQHPRGKLNIDERRQYHKMWILYQVRSRLAWFFFKEVGFLPVEWRVRMSSNQEAPREGWILMDPSKTRYPQIYSLDGLILVFCSFAPVINEATIAIAEECLKARAKKDAKVKSDLLFMVLPDIESLRHRLKLLLEDPESHPTIVPIEESEVRELINMGEKESFYNYLEQLLSEWMFQRDLYKGNFPVSGRRFFGREREIGLLNQNIEDGRPMGIFGLRKCGKTSLLYQLKLIRKNDLVAYVDPEASPLNDCKWLCWRAVREWASQERRFAKILSLAEYQTEDNLPDFSQVLKKFASDLRILMSEISPEAKLILMIDEIEKIIPIKDEEWEYSLEFFQFLRGIAQESQGKFVVIITGANPAICEMSQWKGKDNPIFQFFEEMYLPLLPENECREMIVTLGKGMGVEWEEDALRAVYELTGGHPFITRRLCSAIVNRFRERPLHVTANMVKEAEPELLIRLHDLFVEIKDRLQRDYPDEWDILEALANGFSLDEIRQLVPSYSRALRHLEGYQLIELREGRPRFKIKLMHRWLLEGVL
jgi:cold shock CspA family protein